MAQEVQLKSQISVLEKKAHENWLTARQVERKLEDAKQEAAQLRNRLTLRERHFEDKNQNRMLFVLLFCSYNTLFLFQCKFLYELGKTSCLKLCCSCHVKVAGCFFLVKCE